MAKRSWRCLVADGLLAELAVTFLATRLTLLLVATLAQDLVQPSNYPLRATELPGYLRMLAAYDAEWYLSIARDGYS